jgi:GT2 family glycosyltransferase
LAQTYRPIEIVVVDDGSVDETPAVLAAYGERILVVGQGNRGLPAARNVGIRHASGECIAFLDADDVWLPDKLALQMAALGGSPEAGMAFTDAEAFGEGGVIREALLVSGRAFVAAWLERHRVAERVSAGWAYEEFLIGNWIATPTMAVVRRGALRATGLFDEGVRLCEDYELWLRLVQHFPVVVVHLPLARYRIRVEGLSAARFGERADRYRPVTEAIRERHLKSVPPSLQPEAAQGLERFLWRQAHNLLFGERPAEVRPYARHCLRRRNQVGWAMAYLAASYLPVRGVRALQRVRARLGQGTAPAASKMDMSPLPGAGDVRDATRGGT